jgi:hypothetical protein
MSIKDRIRRLEGRRDASCPECRLKPEVNYVVYPDKDDHTPEPEHCPRCGRSLGFIIEVVYDDEGGG